MPHTMSGFINEPCAMHYFIAIIVCGLTLIH